MPYIQGGMEGTTLVSPFKWVSRDQDGNFDHFSGLGAILINVVKDGLQCLILTFEFLQNCMQITKSKSVTSPF